MVLEQFRLRLVGCKLSSSLSWLNSCLLCLSALLNILGWNRSIHRRLQSSNICNSCLNRTYLRCKLSKCRLHVQNSLSKLCWAWINSRLGLCTPRLLLSRSRPRWHHLLIPNPFLHVLVEILVFHGGIGSLIISFQLIFTY